MSQEQNRQQDPKPKTFVEWGEVQPPVRENRGKQGIAYVVVRTGESAVLRLAAKPISYMKHWSPISAISPGKERDACWQAGHEPKLRFACWCVDRADGQVKSFCFPFAVYEAVSKWAAEQKKDPGGREGVDIRFSLVAVPGRGEGYSEWKVEPLQAAVFSPAEIEAVKALFMGHPLQELFAPDPAERIKALYAEAMANPAGPVPGSDAWERARQGVAPQYDAKPQETLPWE